MIDEEQQDKAEKGLQGTSADEHAYRRVFDALQREPALKLSSGFATRVIVRMRPKPSGSTDVVWLTIGIISMIIALGVAIAMTGFRLNWGVFKFISGYPGLMAFGIAFVIALQWVDRRLMRSSEG